MAAGDSLAIFGAADAVLPSTNYPQFVARNNHLVLAYDTTTQETAYFETVLPQSYGGGGVDFVITYAAQSATSGTASWGVSVERSFDGSLDIDGDSFDSEVLPTAVTVPGTAGILGQITVSLASGDMDGATAGDTIRVRIRRDVANDTATGDIQILTVELVET